MLTPGESGGKTQARNFNMDIQDGQDGIKHGEIIETMAAFDGDLRPIKDGRLKYMSWKRRWLIIAAGPRKGVGLICFARKRDFRAHHST